VKIAAQIKMGKNLSVPELPMCRGMQLGWIDYFFVAHLPRSEPPGSERHRGSKINRINLAFVPAALAVTRLKPGHTLLSVLSVLTIVPLAAVNDHGNSIRSYRGGEARGDALSSVARANFTRWHLVSPR
jgi:hypothetical protein